jgi:hypothetical protein
MCDSGFKWEFALADEQYNFIAITHQFTIVKGKKVLTRLGIYDFGHQENNKNYKVFIEMCQISHTV